MSTKTGTDVLTQMLNELRRDLPPLPHFEDRTVHEAWITSVRLVVQAMPTSEERIACCICLAEDLVMRRYPSLPLALVYDWIERMVLGEEQG